MTASTADTGLAPPASRDRFGAALARLSTKTQTSSLDRALRVAGPVMIPFGLLTIALGWYGAANTTRVFLQIPYLMSGGLIGLSFVFLGGFVYFSRWMTDLIDDGRRQADEAREIAERTARSLERIEQLLASGVAAPVAAPSGTLRTVPRDAAQSAVARPVDGEALVVTAKGSLVHRASCRLVADRPTSPVDEIGDRERCRICRPPVS